MKLRGRNLIRPAGPVALVLASVLVFIAINAGLRLAPNAFLDPLSKGAALDYSRGPLGSIAALRESFIEGALGDVIPQRERAAVRRAARPRIDRPKDEVDPTIVVDHPATNNRFEDAYDVGSAPFTAKSDTNQASAQSGEPDACAGAAGWRTLWYRHRPASGLALTANTFGTKGPVALNVLSGNSLSALQRVECSSDMGGNAAVSFSPVPNTTYYFQVATPIATEKLVFALLLRGVTKISSISALGQQGEWFTGIPMASADGRFVAFNSPAGKLLDRPNATVPQGASHRCLPATVVEEQPLCSQQVFVRDRANKTLTLASQSSKGDWSNSWAAVTGVSANGRFVVFMSIATNLDDKVAGRCLGLASPPCADVFVRDLHKRTTERISVSDTEDLGDDLSIGGSPSGDGRFVAFTSRAGNLVEADTNGVSDVFIRDRRLGTTERVSIADDEQEAIHDDLRVEKADTENDMGSSLMSLSRNGRFVLFRSLASNLVRGDTNRKIDVFLRDRAKGTTVRVSVATDRSQANGDTLDPFLTQSLVTDDGRYALFASEATNLTAVADQNGAEDVFLRDVVRGTTERVTVSSEGKQADGETALDKDPHAYMLTTMCIMFALTKCSEMHYSMTPDARLIVFSDTSTNLAPGDSNELRDIFLRDRRWGYTTRVSVSSSGGQPDQSSNHPVISDDGRFVMFHSMAANLVAADQNGQGLDVFVHEVGGNRRPSEWQ